MTDARFALLAVLVLGVLVLIKRPKHVWRWHSGHTLNGYHHTNATWTRPATKVLHPTGNAVRWHKWPRAARAFIRTAFSGFVLLVLAGLAFAPMPSLIALGALAVAGLWFAVRRAHGKVRRWWPS